MEDNRIIELYLERNENAISETDRKYRGLCYGISYNILHNASDSNEVINDAYLSLWNSIPPNIPNIFSAFIGRIVRNISLKKLRSANTAKRGKGEAALVFEELSECIRSGQDVECEVDTKELSKTVNEFIYSLPETERNIFICRYWYFDPIKNISDQFGFSKSKVKSMLFRTRNKLHKKLKEDKFI